MDDWDAMSTRTRTRTDAGSEVTITETTKWRYSGDFWIHEYAGQAMQAILGANPIMCSHTDDTLPGLAVHVAESLLAELQKDEPGKDVQDVTDGA